MKTAICYCSHLSTFALVFDQGDLSRSDESNADGGASPKIGIYTDFYGMNYWRESFGFLVILGAFCGYIVGLALSIIFDI